MKYEVERDKDGNPIRLIWLGPDVDLNDPSRPPTYDEWRVDEWLRRLNGRPIPSSGGAV